MAFSVHLMSTYVQWRARMFIFVAATEPQAFFAGALIAPASRRTRGADPS